VPSWPVLFKDGCIQVVDADGELFPVMLEGERVSALDEGWSPLALHTDLSPFLLLELRHDSGVTAVWVLSEVLDVQALTIDALPEHDLRRLAEQLGPQLRNLYDEAVRAPHAAIPAAAHELSGFAPSTIQALMAAVSSFNPGWPARVLPEELDVEASARPAGSWPDSATVQHCFNSVRNGDARRVPSPFDATLVPMQERIVFPGVAIFRFLDPRTNIVFYLAVRNELAEGEQDIAPDASSTGAMLFVPALDIEVEAVGSGLPTMLPLLLGYYATHTERAVMLPEMLGLSGFEQHGLRDTTHDLDEHTNHGGGLAESSPLPAGDEEVADPYPVPSSPHAPAAVAARHSSIPNDDFIDRRPETPHPTPAGTISEGNAPIVTDPFPPPLIEDEHQHRPMVAPRDERRASPRSWWQRLFGLSS
jgi:hypothetical protein